MTHKERVDLLWVEIRKRFAHEFVGTEGAVKRLLLKALRGVAREAVQAENARLREALKPFAKYAQHFPEPHVDFETVLMEVTDAPNITFGDCRRAAELLAPTTSGEGK